MKCNCDKWKNNIEKLNGPMVLQQIRNPQYKPNIEIFEFCPWCGKKLENEELESK